MIYKYMYSTGNNAQSGGIRTSFIGCSERYYNSKAELESKYQTQRFRNQINNERLIKTLPTLISEDDDVKYFYLNSSCKQAAIRKSDGALAANINQITGIERDADGNIIAGQFVDRSQNTPCSNAVLGIGQNERYQLKMRKKAEVLQYKNSNVEKKTRKQQYADAVKNRKKGTGTSGQQSETTGTNPNPNNYQRTRNTLILGCPFNSTKYVSNSRSDVPGRNTLLFLDRNVTLRNYF